MKLGIIANPDRYNIKQHLFKVLEWVTIKKQIALISNEIYSVLGDKSELYQFDTKESELEVAKESDVILSIGGDGTILWASRILRGMPKPVIGINSGRLGFLTNTSFELIEETLNELLSGNLVTDRRYLLQAESNLFGTEYAINEFLFLKKDTSAMIIVNAYYDDQLINSYRADGLIVSSPTGSTAYSLSSGGPIVHPESQVILLTPINPHTLTTRPLVLPSNKDVTIRIESQSSEVMFSYDGKNQEISEYPFDVKIKQSDLYFDLYELPSHTYFNTLRQKLMWGRDVRELNITRENENNKLI